MDSNIFPEIGTFEEKAKKKNGEKYLRTRD